MILDYIQANNKMNPRMYFNLFEPQTSSGSCTQAFKQIPIDIRRKLFEIYKHDFGMFGYKIISVNILFF